MVTINLNVTVNHQQPPDPRIGTILKGVQSIMKTQAEVAATLNTAAAQIAKIGGETSTLIAKVKELQDTINAGGDATPEVEAALEAVMAQVKVVDDLVPDA